MGVRAVGMAMKEEHMMANVKGERFEGRCRTMLTKKMTMRTMI